MMDFWSRRSIGNEFGIVEWSRIVSGSCRWCGTSSPVLVVAGDIARVLSQDERLARVTSDSKQRAASSWIWQRAGAVVCRDVCFVLEFLGTIYRPGRGWHLAATCVQRGSHRRGLNRRQSTPRSSYWIHPMQVDVACGFSLTSPLSRACCRFRVAGVGGIPGTGVRLSSS